MRFTSRPPILLPMLVGEPFRAAPQPFTAGSTAPSHDGKHILVIDDDPSIRAMLIDLLMMDGYRVSTAENGAEALRLIPWTQPDLLLLDMRMPVLDGWGVANALKAQGVTIPVLVMTAAQDARHWAEEIDAAGYIAKPFDIGQLLDVIERLLAAN